MIKKSLVILILSLSFFTPGYAEQTFQSLDTIYACVKEKVAKNLTVTDYEVTVMPLDSQLKLPACTEPLEAFTTGLIKAGRTTIGARCNAGKKWSIFNSVDIKVYENVIILSRPLHRGEIINQQDLRIEKRDISKLRGDFVTQMEQIENKQAARDTPAGAILGLRSFIEPKLIKRGDKIIISSAQPALTIRMNGIAMMDGIKGQLIRIKNENSGRVINATVIESGWVSVK